MRADTLFSCFSLSSLSKTGGLQQQCTREGNGFHLTAVFLFFSCLRLRPALCGFPLHRLKVIGFPQPYTGQVVWRIYEWVD